MYLIASLYVLIYNISSCNNNNNNNNNKNILQSSSAKVGIFKEVAVQGADP